MRRLRLKDIINSIDISEELYVLLLNVTRGHRGEGLEIITGNNHILPFPEGKDILIKDFRDLEEQVDFVTKCEIKAMNSSMNIGETVTFINVTMDLWGHAGYPDGDTDKYLGRVKLMMEDIAFVLSIMDIKE